MCVCLCVCVDLNVAYVQVEEDEEDEEEEEDEGEGLSQRLKEVEEKLQEALREKDNLEEEVCHITHTHTHTHIPLSSYSCRETMEMS